MRMIFERLGLPHNPQKDKKSNDKLIRNIVCFLLAFIAISVLVTLIIEGLIRGSVAKLAVNDAIDSTWIGSLASYWGGIIGGLSSGTLAFIGVFYTIRYYKESDEQKEKAAIQPFLNITVESEGKATHGFSLGKVGEDKKPLKVNVNIKNIGNGFANTLVVHTGANYGGLAFINVIEVRESIDLFFMVNEDELKAGLQFKIQYIDSMRNEYIQKYDIKKEDSEIKIECGYPSFLKQN